MKIHSFFALPMLLLAIHCTSESEENQFYKNEQLDEYRFDENQITEETAVEDWKTFLKESQDLIFYSRNNLESLRYQIEECEGAEKFELSKTYARYKKAIDDLERKRLQRDDTFNDELRQYNPISDKRNKEFQKQFKREIIRINVGLGCRFEDVKTFP